MASKRVFDRFIAYILDDLHSFIQCASVPVASHTLLAHGNNTSPTTPLSYDYNTELANAQKEIGKLAVSIVKMKDDTEMIKVETEEKVVQADYYDMMRNKLKGKRLIRNHFL